MRRSLAYVLGPAIHRAAADPQALTEHQQADIGRAARSLLEAALTAEPPDRRLIRGGLEAVVRTFATDPHASESLLRRLVEPDRVREYGHEELLDLAGQLPLLVVSAPDFCADVFVAAFAHDPTSDPRADEQTMLVPSAVMPMTATIGQDYRLSLSALTDAFPSLLAASSSAGIRALVAIRTARADQRSFGYHLEGRPVHVELDQGRSAAFLPDGSGVSDRHSFGHQDEVRALQAFEERLEELATADPGAAAQLVSLVLGQEVPAAIWRRMFRAGSRHPAALGRILAPLAASPVVLASHDLSEPAIAFSAAAFCRLDEHQRASMERSILALATTDDPGLGEYGQQHRDEALLQLPQDFLVTREARELRATLSATVDANAEADRSSDESWHPPTFSDRERLGEQRADVESEANERLKDGSEPVRAFANAHLNAIPTIEATQGIVPYLQTLLDALNSPGADQRMSDAAWHHLTDAARAISRQAGLPCHDDAREVAITIELAASTHRLPEVREGEPARFDATQGVSVPAPRCDAAEGLIRLASRRECERQALLVAIERLANDPVPAVRYKVATFIAILANSEVDMTWTIVERLADDPSTTVRTALVSSLGHLRALDSERVYAIIRRIYAAVDDDARGSTQLRQGCIAIITDRFIWEDDEDAGRLLDDLVRQLPDSAEFAHGIVTRLRNVTTIGPFEDPDPRQDNARHRALGLIHSILVTAIDRYRAIAIRLSRSDNEPGEHTIERGKQSLHLIDTIATEAYFSSGAYDARQSRDPTARPSKVQARWYAEAASTIDVLVDVGVPKIAHRLLETLEHFTEVDQRGVFMRIVATIRTGEPAGYQYEPLAEGLFVRLIERYLAEHRTLLQQDSECSAALVEILDIFLRAGWESAHRITYGLNEIYR